MLPPAFQNHLAQLASLGQQMHRLALGADLNAAVGAARQAITLLKDESLQATRPEIPVSARSIEERLSQTSDDRLRGALNELTRLIQSLGVSKPFLALIQNAPDQRPSPPSHETEEPVSEVRRVSLEGALARHWDRGEHDLARDLMDRLVRSARHGDTGSLSQLSALVVSRHRTISVNIPLLADLLESSGWHEFALKLIDPKRPVLIPGLGGAPVNPNLLLRLLDQPPPIADSVESLVSVLKRKPDKEGRGFRGHAARGLFALTTPLRGEILPVFDYWRILIEAWPVRIPKINPSRFGPPPSGTRGLWPAGQEARWDLFEEHLRTAFGVAENRRQPLSLRREALASIWSGYGGPQSAPKALWIVAYFRTRQILEGDRDLASPQTTEGLRDLQSSGEFATGESIPESIPTADPRRLLRQMTDLAAELGVGGDNERRRPPYLRVVDSRHAEDATGARVTLRRLTALAEGLGSYGIHLEAPFVSALMRASVRSLIDAPGSRLTFSSEPVVDFRKAMYALHPAAAVTGWLEETGAPWPSQDLPEGHHIEGALALLRWIRDREKEPEELMAETAQRYWEIDGRLSGRSWTAVRSNPLEWWRRRLSQGLPSTLGRQERASHDAGVPRSWIVYARNHPEVLADLQALARSQLPGTSALAERILSVLWLRPAS